MSVVTPLHPRRATLVLVLAACGWLVGGCASQSLAPVSAGGGPGGGYAYFEKPSPLDPWTPKIVGWQHRERAQPSVEKLIKRFRHRCQKLKDICRSILV